MNNSEEAAARLRENTDRQVELAWIVIEAQIKQDKREKKTLAWMVGTLAVVTAAVLVFLASTGAFG